MVGEPNSGRRPTRPSRHRHRIEHLLDDRIRGDGLRLGFVGQNDAVAQHVRAYVFDIFGRDVGAALQERPRLGRQRQKDRRARGGAKLDVMFHVQVVFLRLACGEDHLYNVIAHLVVHVNPVHQLPRLEDFLQPDHRLDRGGGGGEGHAVQDFSFFGFRGIVENHLEHEPVHLRFGQRIGALLINGIFRGQHKEGGGQGHGFPAQRDLAFLHGFQQSRLHFGRGAVDFIREQKIGENRPAGRVVFSVLRTVNQRAHNISRQQVRGELDAPEAGLYRRRQRAHRKGFCQPRHAFQQHVTVGQEAHEQPVHQLVLADDDSGNFRPESLHPGGDGLGGFAQCRIHPQHFRGRTALTQAPETPAPPSHRQRTRSLPGFRTLGTPAGGPGVWKFAGSRQLSFLRHRRSNGHDTCIATPDMEKLYIACELGARTSRVMLGSLEHNTLKLGELVRFESPVLADKKALQWNIPEFFNQILRSLLEVGAQDTDIHSISCHSWGGDYLLFDRRETLLTPVYHHLDSRTDKSWASVLRQLTPETIYTETNSPPARCSTLFQLQAEPGRRLRQGEVLLLVADAFNHLLGGIACAEMSLASTTQLYTPVSKTWSRRLINELRLPPQLFPAIVPAGTRLGELKPEIARQTRLEGTQIVATNSHELAAALSSLPLNHGSDWAYVQIGAETLIGTQIHDPITAPDDQARRYAHATCLGGTTNLYRRLVGLSLYDACRKFWLERDRELCDDVLMHLATTASAFEVLIDPNDPRFATPEDMPLKIQAYCRETGQEIPRKPGQIIRCVLESLALTYRQAFHELEVLTGRKFARIYLFGAGENTLLNHFIVNALQVPAIIASPDAAAIGNVIVQALTLRHIPSLEAAHEILRSSYKIQAIIPHQVDWETPGLRLAELTASPASASA